MDKNKAMELILNSHNDLMLVTEKDNPSVSFQAKLFTTEKLKDNYSHVFSVQSTSIRVKIANLAEEKVFINQKKSEIEGKILSGFEDKLIVISKKALKVGDVITIAINSNHNNEILLNEAKKFLSSSKLIHPSIYESYSSSVIKFYQNLATPEQKNLIDKIQFFNKNLNEMQKAAVFYSICSEDPFKILGPPGTGKTETILEIINQALFNDKTVLVCGPSNISVDNILSRFLLSKYNRDHPTSFYRLGSSFKGLVQYNLENMANKAVDFMEMEDDDKFFYKEKYQRKQEFIKNLKKESPLVFSTLFSSLKENFFFDLCIVDEACQATQLECFMGIVKAKKYILVGDPNQLCPITSSLYEHLDLGTILLNQQYRMPADLLKFSNEYFYQNNIISQKTDKFYFFDTSFFNYQEDDSSLSKQNLGEALIIRDVVDWMGEDKEIGVIAPYSAQVILLRELVSCSVETVDGFQGQEKDFIILSMVRSNDDLEVGFLTDKKRINVALTRCKKGLIVVGDSQNFVKDPFLRKFFKFLEENSFVTDPDTFRMMIKDS